MVLLETLKERFMYNGRNLYYKNGIQAGGFDAYGYRVIKIAYKAYKEHRLIWLLVHGRLPDKDLDHINGVKDDNKIDNLREATRQENCYNRKAIGGSSKYKGVSLHKCGKWQTSYALNGKQIYLGMFDTELEAAKAYSNFVKPIHREFYHDV